VGFSDLPGAESGLQKGVTDPPAGV
jgi:hypothetical protein